MADGNNSTNSVNNEDGQPIDKDLELASAIVIAFSPFNLESEDVEFIIANGRKLSETISINLMEWCKKERGDIDITGVAAAYVAVHTLFARYNSWLHEELAELQKSSVEQQEEENPE